VCCGWPQPWWCCGLAFTSVEPGRPMGRDVTPSDRARFLPTQDEQSGLSHTSSQFGQALQGRDSSSSSELVPQLTVSAKEIWSASDSLVFDKLITSSASIGWGCIMLRVSSLCWWLYGPSLSSQQRTSPAAISEVIPSGSATARSMKAREGWHDANANDWLLQFQVDTRPSRVCETFLLHEPEQASK
jgi:hypothetical protein